MNQIGNQDRIDQQLAIRCQLGDDDAWETLVRRWHPRLWRFVSRMLSDADAAEDVLQTTWVRIVRSFASLRDPERVAPWLYRVARGAVVDRLRQAYRQPHSEWLDDVGDDGSSDGVEQVDAWDTIEVGLGRLHAMDREVLVLHYLNQLSVDEVAAVCDVPAGTVKSRLHRARRLVRESFNEQETRP